MKLFRNLLLCTTVALSGMGATAQEITLPADPKPDGFDFVHRTLVLQYTGSTCAYCFNLIHAMDALKADENYNNKFIWAAYHGYKGDDPMYFRNDAISALNPEKSYPAALTGFTEFQASTSQKTFINNIQECIKNCLSRDLMAGIAVNSKLDDNTLTVKAELKAVKTGEFTIGCWLVEDGIEEMQSQIGEMTFNDVIRIAENAYGTEVGTVKAGEKASATFTMTLNQAWKQKNCRLIVFACVDQSWTSVFGKTGEGYIIANAISAPLNTEVPYEYLVPGAIESVEADNEIQIAYLAGDQLEVTAASPLKEVTVYNLQGAVVLQVSPATESTTLSLSALPAGAYIVRADNGKNPKTQKIIKR